MSDNQSNNKRIAKNTILLYFRTFITMIVGLYTGRVMLDALGVENYGINNVVGSIVAMSGLITATMSQAISRYLTYGLGQGDTEKLKITFSTSVTTQIVMALIVCVALETVGVWFLNTGANIPEGRMVAANWVLQCSILSLFIGLVSSPYGAVIVAHEHMSVYAYMSIVDVVLKLAICFAIAAYGGDRLILLSILTVCVALFMRIFYSWYCSRHFEEANYKPKLFDKSMLKGFASFSGWSLFSSTSWMFNTQGINMLINIFFGVTFNAAQGIANTVSGCVEQFVTNFTVAFRPQITKSYAAKEYESCYALVNRSSRFTWMLMLVLFVPVFVEADQLLDLWLVDVPEMASVFLRFTLFNTLAVKFSEPLFVLIQAHGDIKRHSIESSLWGCCIFPFTWIAYLAGAPVWATYPIAIIIRFSIIILRLICLDRLTTYDWHSFVTSTFWPCMSLALFAFSLPVAISIFWDDSILRFFVLVPISVIWVGGVCYYAGLSKSERGTIVEQIKKRIKKR